MTVKMVYYTSPASIDDANYIDFIECLKKYTMRTLEREVHSVYLIREKAFESEHGRKPKDHEEVAGLLDGFAPNTVREFVDYWSQIAMWDRIRKGYEPKESELLEELETKLKQGPGHIELEPALEYPDYYVGRDFHMMPGNYDLDDLSGFVYDYGVKVYYFGVNDDGATQRLLVGKALSHCKRKVERALDIGCGIGQDTLPIKEQRPDAEVIGLDLASPMLKFAHKRAVEKNIDITFVQRTAEDTGYPDNHFDFIFAFQIFHELSLRGMGDIIKECHRILRPGGVFVIADIPRTENITPYRRWLREWQVHNNNEPFMTAYTDSDIPQLLQDGGFENAREELAFEPVPGGAFQIYFQIGEK